MSATISKRGKQMLPRVPQSPAAAWYAAPSFVISYNPYPLTKEQRTKLLGIVGKTSLPDKTVEEFDKHLGVAIGGYIAKEDYFKSIKPERVGRRLKWIRESSLN